MTVPHHTRGLVACLVRDEAGVNSASGWLETLARACSPRVEPHGAEAVLFDAEGLSRVCGPPEIIARDVQALAASHSVAVRVALAGTRTAAWLLAHARPGTTVVPSGQERAALAALPVGWLGGVLTLDRAKEGDRTKGEVECRAHLATFERWGLRTCGDVAALPRADLHARMGPMGVRLHQAACGEDSEPLAPADEPVPFADRLELEWPIDGLEPLSFVLSRQFDRLAPALERADRGAVAVTTRLTLTTCEVHERVLHLPAPMREARVLRTLVLLDLESHPPAAGIDVVEIRLDVTPGRILQGSLLDRSWPSPESVATLLARLGALMGESRVGAPVLLDTHDARQVTMKPFRIKEGKGRLTAHGVRREAEPVIFRRFPLPVSVHVVTERGVPVRVRCAVRDLSGDVIERAGPWRMSGAWWVLDGSGAWDRDEWDVQLSGGVVCRLSRHRAGGTWDIERVLD
jgi:protein ImuB